MNDGFSLIDDYLNWLREEINIDKIGEFYEITTPFLDFENDYIQIYIKISDDKVYFTDDGYILSMLQMQGVKMNSNRIKQLKYIANQFGVQVKNNELIKEAYVSHFPEQKHLFVQALVRIGDMFSNVHSKSTMPFVDDVAKFFDNQKIYYTDNVQFSGKTGLNHIFNFLFTRSAKQPERLCNVANKLDNSDVNAYLFPWVDTQKTRKPDTSYILILNDENSPKEEAVRALENYGAKVVFWNDRKKADTMNLFVA
jgi:prophage protein|nr:MAG TPA: protein of unknown function DUF1829 [Caudoviricetes sp.]